MQTFLKPFKKLAGRVLLGLKADFQSLHEAPRS